MRFPGREGQRHYGAAAQYVAVAPEMEATDLGPITFFALELPCFATLYSSFVALCLRELPLIMSAKVLDFLTPLSAFGTDFYCKIHAASVTAYAFP